MRYEYIRAEQFCDSVRDGTHDTPKPTENGYKLVTGKHIRDGRVDPTEAYYISEKDYNKINERSRVDQWDVLMSMIGNGLGRSAIVYDNPNYAIKNIALFKVRDEIKAKWLHYYLSGSEGQGRIYNYLQGSGQPFISLTYLRDFPVPNPPRGLMSTIVGVLEKYDSLIDNNQKQIKLLEEAAQRLYKEWFIDLRFPGHESTPIVNGLPEGWQKKKTSEVCDTVGGGTPSTAKSEYFENGTIKWVTPTDLTKKNSLILLDTEKKITQAGLDNSSAKLLPPETILMTSRASIGYFAVCEYEVCTNQGFIACIPKDEDMRFYLLFNLMSRTDEIKGKATGSTFLEITKRAFRNMSIIVPEKHIMSVFDKYVSYNVSRMRVLEKENARLIMVRDRLLSKLMSGNLEVSK